jgi:ribulose-5-phosphate 4-epimerase/fuculose-1-phosphate aldolase
MNVPVETIAPASVRQARVDLAAAHRLAVMDDLHEGTWSHLSLTVPGDPGSFLVTPPATHWSQVTASHLVRVGPDDQAEVEARGDVLSVAYRIHGPIHWARSDARAVLHVHSPYIVALSMLENPQLELAEQTALELAGRMAYTDVYDGTFPQDIRHGEMLAETLGDKTILILRNHGAVVVGATMGQAYTDLYVLNRAVRSLILAISTGRPLRHLPAEVAERYASVWEDNQYKHDHFAAMKRVLDETAPGYKD